MSTWRRHPIGSVFAGVPPAVLAILGACLLIWFIEVATIRAWGTWTSWLALGRDGLMAGKVWQLVTYQFLHDPRGVAHLLFNAIGLFMFGRALEQRWGTAGFVRYYLACGVGGGLAYVLVAALLGDRGTVVGASGAVLGLAIAFALIWPNATFLVFFVLPIQARHAVVIFVLLDLMFAWVGAMGGQATGAVAHLGGLATGWLYLAHAYRLRGLGARARGLPASARRWWRRRRMTVADQDFDSWLRKNDDDVRH